MVYQICIELPAPNIQSTAVSHSFFPEFIKKLHSKDTVSKMVLENIQTWSGILNANMTCGLGMPLLPIRVYQFVPKGLVLQRQFQYLSSGSPEKQSVPIGMKRIDERMLHVCNEYIEQIASHHMDSFAKLCWKEEENKFQEEIFKLIMNCVENEVIRLVRRLVVATFIMSHTLTIDKVSGSSTEVLDMVSHNIFASSRLLNRQLKYPFHHIQRNLMQTTLSNLKNTLVHPDSYDNWRVAFIAVIGLCMASENQQKTIHLVMETNINTEKLSRHGSDITADPKDGDETLRQKYEAEGNRACEAIDSVTMFLIHAFCQWSRRSLQNLAHEEGSRNIISEIIQLVKANCELYHPPLKYNQLTSYSGLPHKKKRYYYRASQLERLHIKARSKSCVYGLGSRNGQRERTGKRRRG
jgi:hypothetical protein